MRARQHVFVQWCPWMAWEHCEISKINSHGLNLRLEIIRGFCVCGIVETSLPRSFQQLLHTPGKPQAQFKLSWCCCVTGSHGGEEVLHK